MSQETGSDGEISFAGLYRERSLDLRRAVLDSPRASDAAATIARFVDGIFATYIETVDLRSSQRRLAAHLQALVADAAALVTATGKVEHIHGAGPSANQSGGSGFSVPQGFLIRAVLLIAVILIIRISYVSDACTPAEGQGLPIGCSLLYYTPFLVGLVLILDALSTLSRMPGRLLDGLWRRLRSLTEVGPRGDRALRPVPDETHFLVDADRLDGTLQTVFNQVDQTMAAAGERAGTGAGQPQRVPTELLTFFQDLWYARETGSREDAFVSVEAKLDWVMDQFGVIARCHAEADAPDDFAMRTSYDGREQTLLPALYDRDTGRLLMRGRATSTG